MRWRVFVSLRAQPLGPPLVCVDTETGEHTYAARFDLPPGSAVVHSPIGMPFGNDGFVARAWVECPTCPTAVEVA